MIFKKTNNKATELNTIAESIRRIEESMLDKDESRFRALYDYIIKQYEIEIARTRALESKTNSLLTLLTIVFTAYTSICTFILKSNFNPDLLAQYILLIVGFCFLLRASWFWRLAANAKEFELPNVDKVLNTVKQKHRTPESVYNQLFANIERPTIHRRKVNKEFGVFISNISKSIAASIAIMLFSIVTTPVSWYSTQLVSKNEIPTKVEIYFMTNYVEPEETQADDVEVALESEHKTPSIPAEEE